MNRIRPATLADMEDVAGRLREMDRQECLALTGLPPEAVIPKTWTPNTMVACGDDGRPELLFGADPAPHYPNVGVVWMTSTPEIYRHRMEFLRASKVVVDGWQQKFDILTNWVDSRNDLHVMWIKWLGFQLIRTAPLGPRSIPFHEFVRIAPCA